jgi:hypothetical protein
MSTKTSEKIERLKEAGLVIHQLSEEARKRLESLQEEEVEALIQICKKVSDPHKGPALSFNGGRQKSVSDEA